MFERPPLDQMAFGALIVGVLFVLRCLLALRRIRAAGGGAGGFALSDIRRATEANAFGSAMEPDRRYAARQLYSAAAFLGAGLLLLAWLLVSNVLGPFVARGLAV